MKNFSIKFFILLFLVCHTTNVFAADLKLRIVREEFADFYGSLVIEQEYNDLSLDGFFYAPFDPITGKLKNDELFSQRSPYFGLDIFKKQQQQEQQQLTQQNNVQEQGFQNVYNLKLSPAPQPPKDTFKDKLIAVNNMAEKGKNPQQTAFMLSELEKEAAGDAIKLSNIAKIYLKVGNKTKALALLKQASTVAPNDYKIIYTYGVTLYKNNDLINAESNLLKTSRLKPDFMYAYYNLGNVYYKKKEYKKALDSFKKAMELDPKKPDIYFNIALTLEALNYKETAKTFYSKCLELNPKDSEALKAIQRIK